MRAFDVEIYDQPFDPDSSDKIVYYYERGDQYLYKVFIFLVGRDIPFVNKAVYYLHHTFPNPERTVFRTDANPKCKLVTWAWGKFNLKAIVVDKKGNQYMINRFLQFDQYFEEETFKKENLRLIKTR